jgi:hypothetical protein
LVQHSVALASSTKTPTMGEKGDRMREILEKEGFSEEIIAKLEG